MWAVGASSAAGMGWASSSSSSFFPFGSIPSASFYLSPPPLSHVYVGEGAFLSLASAQETESPLYGGAVKAVCHASRRREGGLSRRAFFPRLYTHPTQTGIFPPSLP